MRQVSDNVHAEIYFWGCNPGFVTTSDGVFMIDTPQQPINAVQWRERISEYGPIRHLVNTEPHGDHILGNSYFPGVEVIGQTLMEARYEETIPRMQSDERVEQMQETDPDSVWLLQHPHYPPNPPTRLFDKELMITLGDHTIELHHIPGHTPPQTAVYLRDEGVVFTGDNVFHRMMSFVQEADPWEWLEALKRIEALGAEVIVPGHGEPCDNSYLSEQATVIEGWIDAVEDFVKRGLTEAEALNEPRPDVDPYPIGQRLYPATDRIKALNVGNVYRHVVARQSG
jgi:cyclase